MRDSRTLCLRFVVAALMSMWLATIPSCSSDSSTELLDAAGRGDLQAVKSLVQGGASIDRPSSAKLGWTPLHNAIFHNQKEIVFYLIDAGADVNLADRNGVTPLMWAAAQGDEAVPMVKYLIAHGARLDDRNRDGTTVFDYATSDPPKPKLIEVLNAARREKQ